MSSVTLPLLFEENLLLEQEGEPDEDEDDDISTDDGHDLRHLFEEEEDDLDTEDGEILSDEDEDDFETVIETSANLRAFLEDIENAKGKRDPEKVVTSPTQLKVTLREPEALAEPFTIGGENEDEDEDDFDTDIGSVPFASVDKIDDVPSPSAMSIAFIPNDDESDEEWLDEDSDEALEDEDSADGPTDAVSSATIAKIIHHEAAPKAATDSETDHATGHHDEDEDDEDSDEEIIHNSHPTQARLMPRPPANRRPPEIRTPSAQPRNQLKYTGLISLLVLLLAFFFAVSTKSDTTPEPKTNTPSINDPAQKPQKGAVMPTEVDIQSADDDPKSPGAQ